MCFRWTDRKRPPEGRVYGSNLEGEPGKTVVLDYSSINVAKPFHIGHLRTTVIGNSISPILKFMGYKTVSINYLGDWGTQFGKMLVAYRKWGEEEKVQKDGIRYLVSLYVRFHDEAERVHPELNDEARSAFTAMEHGDEESLKLWRHFVDISLKDVQKSMSFWMFILIPILGKAFSGIRPISSSSILKKKAC